MKYILLAPIHQAAIVETKSNLNLAKKLFKPFKNNLNFVVIGEYKTKVESENWLNRCKVALSFQAGRINKWITPMFFVVKI